MIDVIEERNNPAPAAVFEENNGAGSGGVVRSWLLVIGGGHCNTSTRNQLQSVVQLLVKERRYLY